MLSAGLIVFFLPMLDISFKNYMINNYIMYMDVDFL